MKVKIPIIILFINIAISLIACTPELETNEFGKNGKIAFLWQPEAGLFNGLDLILMDGNGNSLRYVGFFSGSPAFSKDGKKIAVGCPLTNRFNGEEPRTDICILDVEKIVSFKTKIPIENYSRDFAIEEKISLPEQCQEYQYDQREMYEGIKSIDWSPAGDKLIIVCGDFTTSEVCTLELDGENECWAEKNSTGVYRAEWSPVNENIILVSGSFYPTSEVYLVNIDGEKRRYLGNGWNAEWFSDGKSIVFAEHLEDPETKRYYHGIASIDITGKNYQWIYLPDSNNSASYLQLDGYHSGVPTRISVSPDDKHLVLSGTNLSMYHYGLFRLDIETDDIFNIVDTWIFSGILSEPDWGP